MCTGAALDPRKVIRARIPWKANSAYRGIRFDIPAFNVTMAIDCVAITSVIFKPRSNKPEKCARKRCARRAKASPCGIYHCAYPMCVRCVVLIYAVAINGPRQLNNNTCISGSRLSLSLFFLSFPRSGTRATTFFRISPLFRNEQRRKKGARALENARIGYHMVCVDKDSSLRWFLFPLSHRSFILSLLCVA